MTGDRTARGHVLVLDDEPGVAQVTRHHLSRAGFTAETFTTCAEAFDAFRLDPHAFDAAVIDVGLPDMSGLALTGLLRQLRPELPVIIVSGDLDPAAVRAAGCIGLEKPFDPTQLAAALEAALRASARLDR